MYEFNLPELTRAPKGYRPVYISHFGRQGARYALGTAVYEDLHQILAKGLEKGKLTEKGIEFKTRYDKFYPSVAHRGGELTFKGQEQHRMIARMMYENFPEVFKGKTVADAISTDSHRVIMSMAAFTNELDRLDKDFEFKSDAGKVYFPSIKPGDRTSPEYIKSKPRSEAANRTSKEMQEKKLDLRGFASRFFNDPDYLEENYGLYKFMMDVRTMIVDLPSLDQEPEDRFEDIMTPEEFINFWEVWNYNGYLSMGRSPLTDNLRCLCMTSALRTIMDEAEQDLKDGKVQLRLRFTHDVALLPLLSFMGVNSFGARISEPEAVKDYWRCYDVPMASNLQLIFYKNRKTEDILVKVLLNGKEASLPIKPEIGTFYSWKDMEAYYYPIMDEADRFLKNYQK